MATKKDILTIEVEEEYVNKVFEILLNNGKFSGLPNNRFLIEEHGAEVLKKLDSSHIKYKIIDGK